jgi:hypothetical protein
MRRSRPASGAVALMFALLSPALASAETLDCVIEPKAVIDLVVSEKGRVSEILVRRGDVVAKIRCLYASKTTCSSCKWTWPKSV